MISLTEIILRLRQECPVFTDHVGGTLEFGEAFQDSTADLALPFCFVIPMDEIDVSALLQDDAKPQDLRFFFATIVAVDNSANRGAPGGGIARMQPFDQLVAIKEDIQKALMGWEPLQRFGPVRFSKGGNLGMDNMRLWYQWEWFVSQTVDPDVADADADAIAAIVDGMDDTDIPAPGEEFLARLKRIYVNYGLGEEANRISLDDFWTTRQLQSSGVPDASEETIAEATEGAEAVIEVPDDIPPVPSPTGKDLDAAAFHRPTPEPENFHGESVENDKEKPE